MDMKLERCPHCGGPVKINSVMIVCDACAMGVTFASGDMRPGRQFLFGDDLKKAWNKREAGK